MTFKNIPFPTPLTSPCLTLNPAVQEQNLALPDPEEDARSYSLNLSLPHP